jgi:hypothetical protein
VKGTKNFSSDNYGNDEDVVTEIDSRTNRKIHKVVKYRTTLFTDTIEAKFNEATWTTIVAEARKLAPKAVTKTKNQKSARGKK